MTTAPLRAFASKDPIISALDASVRYPVLACLLSAVHWLVTGTFLMVYAASLRHPQNGFIGLDVFTYLSQNFAAFTFGRVWATAFHCLIYGWAGTVSMGLSVWLITRITQRALCCEGILVTALVFWNLAIAAGLTEIFLGFGTGVEFLEFPAWVNCVMLLSYSIFSVWGVVTISRVTPERLFISLPWILLSLLAFPWLFGAATVTLSNPIPGTGVAQALVAAWFSHGLFTLWLGPIAIATLYYLVSKTSGMQIRLYSWAQIAFWLWVFLVPWSAVHDLVGGPVPYWTVALGLLLSGLAVIPTILIAYSLIRTCLDAEEISKGQSIVIQFMTLGASFFALTGVAELILSVRPLNTLLRFTIFREADLYLWIFGLFSFTAFGAFYYIIPRLMDFGWRSVKWVRTHYYASLYGILLVITFTGFGGVLQGLKLENSDPTVSIDTSTAITLSYYISITMCLSIISIGNGVFIAHLGWLIVDRLRTFVRGDSTLAELTFEPYEAPDTAAPQPTEATR